MHRHLLRFVVIQFFSDICFVFGGESGPRFVGSPVVVVCVGGLDVLVETQDLPGLEFGHRGSLGQLMCGMNMLTEVCLTIHTWSLLAHNHD